MTAQHIQLGKLGEKVAARHLILEGYTILATDWHFGHRDLDIICRKDGTTVFVEVKTRSTNYLVSPEEAVDSTKTRNILAAARAYIQHNRIDGPVRIDVITVVGNAEPFEITHYVDAINPYSLRR